jgi:hypothetical protein
MKMSFGRNYGSLKYLQNTLTSSGEFYMKLCLLNLIYSKRASSVTTCALTAKITLKLAIMCSLAVIGLNRFGSPPL